MQYKIKILTKKQMMIMKRIFIVLLMGLFIQVSAYAQKTEPANNPLALNSYGLHPVLVKKDQWLIQFSVNIPHYYKWYSASAGKPEPVSPKMVFNEAYFKGMVSYGLSSQLNLNVVLPVNDLHYYSPMGIEKGIGLGDMQVGLNMNLLNNNKKTDNNLTGGISIGIPTGKYYNLKPGRLPLGTGSVSFQANLTGLHKTGKLNLIYSAYYTFLTNHSSLITGNETGGYFIIQEPFNTKVGQFGLEASSYGYYKGANKFKSNHVSVPNTKNYGVDLGIGGWFNYQKNLSIRVNVPFTIFQNKAWFTRYQVLTQIDYLF